MDSELHNSPVSDKAAKKLSTTEILIESDKSSVTWIHQPQVQKFVSTADIMLSFYYDNEHDFMSPDLGKLCEKFLHL